MKQESVLLERCGPNPNKKLTGNQKLVNSSPEQKKVWKRSRSTHFSEIWRKLKCEKTEQSSANFASFEPRYWAAAGFQLEKGRNLHDHSFSRFGHVCRKSKFVLCLANSFANFNMQSWEFHHSCVTVARKDPRVASAFGALRDTGLARAFCHTTFRGGGGHQNAWRTRTQLYSNSENHPIIASNIICMFCFVQPMVTAYAKIRCSHICTPWQQEHCARIKTIEVSFGNYLWPSGCGLGFWKLNTPACQPNQHFMTHTGWSLFSSSCDSDTEVAETWHLNSTKFEEFNRQEWSCSTEVE